MKVNYSRPMMTIVTKNARYNPIVDLVESNDERDAARIKSDPILQTRTQNDRYLTHLPTNDCNGTSLTILNRSVLCEQHY